MYKNYERNVELMRDYHSGDPVKKAKAVEELLKSVELFIHMYLQRYSSFINADNYEDFVQIANMAIIKGLPKYNPEYSLTTFIPNEIKHEIQKYISEIRGMSSHYSQRVNNVVRTIEKLQFMGLEKPTAADIASVLGLTEKQVIEALQMRDSSLVWNYENEDECSLLFNKHERSPEDIYEQRETEQLLLEALKKLDDLDKCCVLHSFGACGFCKLKNKEIAEKYNLTLYEVKLKITRALKQLRKNIKNSDKSMSTTRKQKCSLDNTEIPVFANADIEVYIKDYDEGLFDSDDADGFEEIELN